MIMALGKIHQNSCNPIQIINIKDIIHKIIIRVNMVETRITTNKHIRIILCLEIKILTEKTEPRDKIPQE